MCQHCKQPTREVASQAPLPAVVLAALQSHPRKRSYLLPDDIMAFEMLHGGGGGDHDDDDTTAVYAGSEDEVAFVRDSLSQWYQQEAADAAAACEEEDGPALPPAPQFVLRDYTLFHPVCRHMMPVDQVLSLPDPATPAQIGRRAVGAGKKGKLVTRSDCFFPLAVSGVVLTPGCEPPTGADLAALPRLLAGTVVRWELSAGTADPVVHLEIEADDGDLLEGSRMELLLPGAPSLEYAPVDATVTRKLRLASWVREWCCDASNAGKSLQDLEYDINHSGVLVARSIRRGVGAAASPAASSAGASDSSPLTALTSGDLRSDGHFVLNYLHGLDEAFTEEGGGWEDVLSSVLADGPVPELSDYLLLQHTAVDELVALARWSADQAVKARYRVIERKGGGGGGARGAATAAAAESSPAGRRGAPAVTKAGRTAAGSSSSSSNRSGPVDREAVSTPLVASIVSCLFGNQMKKMGRPAARRVRCGTCAGCTLPDCGACSACKDKAGAGRAKQACKQRACDAIGAAVVGEGGSDDDDGGDDEEGAAAAAAAAASRLAAAADRGAAAGDAGDDDDGFDVDVDGDDEEGGGEAAPAPLPPSDHRRKQRRPPQQRKPRGASASRGAVKRPRKSATTTTTTTITSEVVALGATQPSSTLSSPSIPAVATPVDGSTTTADSSASAGTSGATTSADTPSSSTIRTQPTRTTRAAAPAYTDVIERHPDDEEEEDVGGEKDSEGGSSDAASSGDSDSDSDATVAMPPRKAARGGPRGGRAVTVPRGGRTRASDDDADFESGGDGDGGCNSSSSGGSSDGGGSDAIGCSGDEEVGGGGASKKSSQRSVSSRRRGRGGGAARGGGARRKRQQPSASPTGRRKATGIRGSPRDDDDGDEDDDEDDDHDDVDGAARRGLLPTLLFTWDDRVAAAAAADVAVNGEPQLSAASASSDPAAPGVTESELLAHMPFTRPITAWPAVDELTGRVYHPAVTVSARGMGEPTGATSTPTTSMPTLSSPHVGPSLTLRLGSCVRVPLSAIRRTPGAAGDANAGHAHHPRVGSPAGLWRSDGRVHADVIAASRVRGAALGLPLADGLEGAAALPASRWAGIAALSLEWDAANRTEVHKAWYRAAAANAARAIATGTTARRGVGEASAAGGGSRTPLPFSFLETRRTRLSAHATSRTSAWSNAFGGGSRLHGGDAGGSAAAASSSPATAPPLSQQGGASSASGGAAGPTVQPTRHRPAPAAPSDPGEILQILALWEEEGGEGDGVVGEEGAAGKKGARFPGRMMFHAQRLMSDLWTPLSVVGHAQQLLRVHECVTLPLSAISEGVEVHDGSLWSPGMMRFMRREADRVVHAQGERYNALLSAAAAVRDGTPAPIASPDGPSRTTLAAAAAAIVPVYVAGTAPCSTGLPMLDCAGAPSREYEQLWRFLGGHCPVSAAALVSARRLAAAGGGGNGAIEASFHRTDEGPTAPVPQLHSGAVGTAATATATRSSADASDDAAASSSSSSSPSSTPTGNGGGVHHEFFLQKHYSWGFGGPPRFTDIPSVEGAAAAGGHTVRLARVYVPLSAAERAAAAAAAAAGAPPPSPAAPTGYRVAHVVQTACPSCDYHRTAAAASVPRALGPPSARQAASPISLERS